MPLSQRAQSLAVSTPFGEDILLLRAMDASEHPSTLFAYQLELISKDITINPDDLLGQPVTVRLEFTAPGKDLLTKRHHPYPHARADLEIYDYPGGYTKLDQGDDWVRVSHPWAGKSWGAVAIPRIG